jgi:hypothetical protein
MILAASPQFGPNSEILTVDRDRGIAVLKVNLPLQCIRSTQERADSADERAGDRRRRLDAWLGSGTKEGPRVNHTMS